jgi:hypothetical protein
MKWSNSALALVAALSFGITSSLTVIPVIASTTTPVTDVAPETVVPDGFSLNLSKRFSEHQAKLLTMVYQVAKDDGHEHPQLLQGLLLQETNAGETKLRKGSDCYGIFQIKLVAAREALRAYPSLWEEFGFRGKSDKEVISKLKNDERFNASVASKYTLVLSRLGYVTIAKLALAFNLGPHGAKSKNPRTNRYTISVLKNIKSLESDRL